MAARVEGKVAIVTGAGQGMGAAHALALSREGASVACVDVCKDLPSIPFPGAKEAELNRVVEDIKAMGHRAIPVTCDISKAVEVEAMVKRVLDEFGKIDILVNNAGVCTFGAFWEITEEEWDLNLDVNLKGTWLCCKYVVPHMIAQKWGRIVNVGSISGRNPEVMHAHYCAAKGGVHTMTLAMARELGAYNITVNCIGPGGVITPMFQWAGDSFGAGQGQTPDEFFAGFNQTFTIMNRQVYPEDVARVMMSLVTEESWTLTGQVVFVDGGQAGMQRPPWEQ